MIHKSIHATYQIVNGHLFITVMVLAFAEIAGAEITAAKVSFMMIR